MLSKCIKMPKYSFKRNLFFAIWGGVSDWFWPTHHPTHLTCITVAAPRIVLAAPSIMSAAQHILSAAPCIVSAARNKKETFGQHQVQIFFLAFSRVKK